MNQSVPPGSLSIRVIGHLDRWSEVELSRTGAYGAWVHSVRPYGPAALLQLHASTLEGLSLAIWVHGDVFQTSSFDSLREASGGSRSFAMEPPLPWIVVRGTFRRHPWAARLSLDLKTADDLLVAPAREALTR